LGYQAIEKRQQATIDEKIGTLQSMRADLITKKVTVEKQLQDLETRMKEKKRKGLDSASPNSPDEERPSNGG
jgi:hypothetical protein